MTKVPPLPLSSGPFERHVEEMNDETPMETTMRRIVREELDRGFFQFVDLLDKDKESIFYDMVRKGNLPRVKWLIGQGVPIDLVVDGKNGLHIASKHDQAEMCLFFLDKGIDIEAPTTHKGNTALHDASFHESTNACAALIERDANVNATNNKKETPLHILVSGPPKYIVKVLTVCKLLVGHGALTDAIDDNGNTPYEKFTNRAEYYDESESKEYKEMKTLLKPNAPTPAPEDSVDDQVESFQMSSSPPTARKTRSPSIVDKIKTAWRKRQNSRYEILE